MRPIFLRSFLPLFLACCLGSTLPACAPLPSAPAGPDVASALGPAMSHFSIQGRAMIRQGQRIDHLRFDWEHTTASDVLLLASPFGQGIARVSRDTDSARIALADGRLIERATLDALTVALFGTELPLAELPEWLRGARAPMHTVSQGWEITVEEAETFAVPSGSVRLPRVISANRDEVFVRLVVDTREVGNE